MHNIKIAVIGKSSAGKSAFIRSFSSTPNYINSVGKGQTTRAYAEYLFLKNFDSEFPLVEARIATQSEFAENRVTQVLDKFKNEIPSQNNYDVNWIKEQFKIKIYDSRIKNFMLFTDDFFNIKEFLFIDENIVKKSDGEYDKLKKELLELETETSEGTLEELLVNFYKKIYEILLGLIEEKFKENQIYVKENNISYFKFSVDEKKNELFSLLLKVDEMTKSSFTGIITKVRVSSKINSKYEGYLKNIEFDNITLIDTYGLDHSESIDRNMLVERYNKIFNKDYPDISTAFLVEALHTGASNEFKKAITTLYEVKPEIMTYIIGTYIDENEKELIDKDDWLFSEDKTLYDAPILNGKVLQILDEKINLEATLLDQGITESMAEKRCEVMQKRFAPFCGDISKSSGEIDYEKVNTISIKALFLSISDREHLGDGYIEINKIIDGICNSEVLKEFAEVFIDNAKIRFKQIYDLSASRTRWKIRENLEHYMLGFDGTTIEATWVRVFRDAFNQTFTKQISIYEKKLMLSEILEMEGNSKIAFDEMIATMYPYIFKRKCIEENKLDAYISVINCIGCANDKAELNDCVWNIFITAATFEMFGKRNDYQRVIDWLYALHEFSSKDVSCFVNTIGVLFKKVIEEQLIPLCRERNIYIASKKLKQSSEPYVIIKKEILNSYKKYFDNTIEDKYFFERINAHLCQ
ncbi:hypothetical protein [Acetoanaerobium sticklandii]|uniref:hypothetical protein n=1 Tax=Acetoanaerobium sticklandii TaxID=1511 RepID=UPI003A8E1E04